MIYDEAYKKGSIRFLKQWLYVGLEDLKQSQIGKKL